MSNYQQRDRQPEQRPTQTYGESLRRARQSGAAECPHGELRGPSYCAICRGVRSPARGTWG